MIGLIGSLCNNRESASGQAIRTTVLYHALVGRYGVESVYCVDTHGFLKHPLSVLIRTLVCIKKCDHIITMVHENGRKVFFPILGFAAKKLKRNVYHNVIGGSYAEYLNLNKYLIKYAKLFRVNWVQMDSQIEKLKKLGIYNCELLPNTKEISPISCDEIKHHENNKYNYCTCSRISLAKGIEKAIYAIEQVNQYYGYEIATLDIYGKPDAGYEDRFNELMKSASHAIRYCGFIPNDKTVSIIKDYYMLLFPTTYEGEGFPGTVWDAFAAGLPVIATDWHYNAEIIEDGKTGLIYDYHHDELLKDKIIQSIENENEVYRMRIKCLNEIAEYLPNNVFPIIYKYLD